MKGTVPAFVDAAAFIEYLLSGFKVQILYNTVEWYFLEYHAEQPRELMRMRNVVFRWNNH